MKKQDRKLRLSRETLRSLQIAGPGKVVGGMQYTVTACATNDCATDGCNEWPTQDWGCTTQDFDCRTAGHTGCC